MVSKNAFLYALISFTYFSISFTVSCPVKTVEGKCCVFPFIYDGKSYSSCTTKGHIQPWCSLTANVDKDEKWGNCKSPCQVKTVEGKCCMFPFIHKGKTYSSCTTKDSKSNRRWCSLTADFDMDKKWGDCNISCPVETFDKRCCVFPFIYDGKSYSSCTTKGFDSPWCSLTENYDKDKKWGNCGKTSCPMKTFGEECCVFPFKYMGTIYPSCITLHINRPWCSLTGSFDRDRKWGNCNTACPVKTLSKQCCVFPFIYKGKTYNSCTTKDAKNPWCSLTANAKDNEWGYCDIPCPMKTFEEQCCVFPFIYKGKSYDSCIKKDHNRTWCSLTANYDKDRKMGNCKIPCPVKTFKKECCVFPFIYKGKSYASCTTKDSDRPWCSLTANYDKDKRSGNCNTLCTVKTFKKEECCVFPFILKGKTYTSCTRKYDIRPWCSLTANFDKDEKEGYCNISCPVKTFKDECCAFPFIYKGKNYTSCITKDNNRLWCGLTENVDKDQAWGNCKSACPVKTFKKECCVFPFIYKGKSYDSCTTKDRNRPWCSLTSNYDKDMKSGNCNIPCPVKTFKGECCVFPFIYKGKSYDSCTTKDRNRPWCSLTVNYDKDKKSGICNTSCPVKTFENECCVFPFIYDGKSYQSCTTQVQDQPWCSLTANMDKDLSWGNCNTACPVKTFEKECCVFPFIYKGKNYASCTTKDSNRPWCSLTASFDKDKKSGNCNSSCSMKTFKEECCVFPYIYKGKTYSSCTTKDSNRPWCSLTASFDKDKKSGNCKTSCPVKTLLKECCVFPFIYKGKSYASCTTMDFDRPWCALTASYDKDKKTGICMQ